ncbi:hypothetical protein ABFV54_27035, partial [Pseudomonas syringae]
TMGGAIGASLAVTVWDDHASIARSEIVSNMDIKPTLNTLQHQGFSYDTALGTISNLVNKEALTVAADHVFLVFSMIFLVGAIIIWFCPKPRK